MDVAIAITDNCAITRHGVVPVKVGMTIAIAVRGAITIRRGDRLQAADRGIFVFPTVEICHQIAPELHHGRVGSHAPFDLAEFVAGVDRLAFLEQLLRSQDDARVAFVESGSRFDLNLHLHGTDFHANRER